LPIANADDLRGLSPGDLFGYGTQDHFVYFHRPLPGGFGASLHASYWHARNPAASKRTLHVLIEPDI
jgi:hypothetical protein